MIVLLAITRRRHVGVLLEMNWGDFLVDLLLILVFAPSLWLRFVVPFYALKLAWSNSFRKIILEIDFAATLSLIHKDVDIKYPYALVICKVQELLSRNWDVRVVKIFREANHAANCLASLGHFIQLGVCFYFDPPNYLRSILYDNLVGVALLDWLCSFVLFWALCPVQSPK